MTRLFFDENVPVQLMTIVAATYPMLHLGGYQALGTAGVDDEDLFPMVAAAGFDVFVTTDIAQMEDPRRRHERSGVRQAGLHWIGYAQPNKLTGLHRIGSEAATLLRGMPYVLDEIAREQRPQCFKLRGLGRGKDQALSRHEDV